jgi:hypothetical protein
METQKKNIFTSIINMSRTKKRTYNRKPKYTKKRGKVTTRRKNTRRKNTRRKNTHVGGGMFTAAALTKVAKYLVNTVLEPACQDRFGTSCSVAGELKVRQLAKELFDQIMRLDLKAFIQDKDFRKEEIRRLAQSTASSAGKKLALSDNERGAFKRAREFMKGKFGSNNAPQGYGVAPDEPDAPDAPDVPDEPAVTALAPTSRPSEVQQPHYPAPRWSVPPEAYPTQKRSSRSSSRSSSRRSSAGDLQTLAERARPSIYSTFSQSEYMSEPTPQSQDWTPKLGPPRKRVTSRPAPRKTSGGQRHPAHRARRRDYARETVASHQGRVMAPLVAESPSLVAESPPLVAESPSPVAESPPLVAESPFSVAGTPELDLNVWESYGKGDRSRAASYSASP